MKAKGVKVNLDVLKSFGNVRPVELLVGRSITVVLQSTLDEVPLLLEECGCPRIAGDEEVCGRGDDDGE